MAMDVRPKGVGDYVRDVRTFFGLVWEGIVDYVVSNSDSYKKLEDDNTALRETIEGKNDALDVLNGKLGVSEVKLKNGRTKIGELENQNFTRDKQIREYQRQIEESSQMVRLNSARMREKDAKIAELEEARANYAVLVDETNVCVRRLEEMVESGDALRRTMEDELEDYKIRVAGLEQTRTEISNQLKYSRGAVRYWKKIAASQRKDYIGKVAELSLQIRPNNIVAIVDSDDLIVQVSERAARILGTNANELKKRNVYDLVNDSVHLKARLGLTIPKRMRDKVSAPQVSLIKSDGSMTKPFDLVVSPLYNDIILRDNKKSVYAGCVITFETRRERRERQVREAGVDHVPGTLKKISAGLAEYLHLREKGKSQES